MSLQSWLGGVRLARTPISHVKVNFSPALRNKNIEHSLGLRQQQNESDIVSRDEYVPARFEEIKELSLNTQKALRHEFKYTSMSKVQDAVLSQAPIEGDLFVKAKTGTGKTLAFLIPAVETMLPQQIAIEAERLTRFHRFKVHCLVGGERRDAQIRKLMKYRVDIVVGTPGRVGDLLESISHFRRQCGEIKTLILDEADQLLDMGFREDIERIIDYYPKDRQTFLFSATVSPEIRQISKFALKPDYTFIDTVDPNDVNTNHQIKQLYSITPYGYQLPVIRKIINDHKKNHRNSKIMMFLPTKMSTMLYSDLIRNLDEMEVFELHSGKSQEMRTKISSRFRNSKRESILVTSDVSARGVDYPGVTMVLQVGAPSSREQYIHRIGRTGRAGKEGEGVLLLAPFEKGFMNSIEDLPLQPVEGIDNDTRGEDDPEIRRAVEMLDVSALNNHFIRKDDLVDSIHDLAQSFGSEVRISPSMNEVVAEAECEEVGVDVVPIDMKNVNLAVLEIDDLLIDPMTMIHGPPGDLMIQNVQTDSEIAIRVFHIANPAIVTGIEHIGQK
ncbi:12988_t:CDS:2 [Acaulospora colombiana]|uniref:12988_t:CDS:1 n=1 Tax=Acaulospora colombiana TaxID=27376 RepID=A0ACA9LSY2_9GLOM|nr:12988_t:CDS:2 [Acaulospora colombiana]